MNNKFYMEKKIIGQNVKTLVTMLIPLFIPLSIITPSPFKNDSEDSLSPF